MFFDYEVYCLVIIHSLSFKIIKKISNDFTYTKSNKPGCLMNNDCKQLSFYLYKLALIFILLKSIIVVYELELFYFEWLKNLPV